MLWKHNYDVALWIPLIIFSQRLEDKIIVPIYMEKVLFFPNSLLNKAQINTELGLRSFWLPALRPQLLQCDPKKEWGRTEVVAGIQLRPRYAFWHFWYTALPKGQPIPTPARCLIFNWLLLGSRSSEQKWN